MFQYYQPNYQQNYQQSYQQNYQPQQDERIWVSGRTGAECYLVAPNSFVRLWDSQEQVFYEKRADQVGRPYIEEYEYKLKGMPESKSEIALLKERVDALEKEIMKYVQHTDDTSI